MRRYALALSVIGLVNLAVAAQETARFEVASVRHNTSPPQPGLAGGAEMGIFPHGDVRITNADLYTIILEAFGIDDARSSFEVQRRLRTDDQIGAKFDIEGKGGTGDGRNKLRTLLVERFGLKTHTETRTIPMYAATVTEPGKLGPFLKLQR
jgi:uncharacterized protein (TIGR03435 family)